MQLLKLLTYCEDHFIHFIINLLFIICLSYIHYLIYKELHICMYNRKDLRVYKKNSGCLPSKAYLVISRSSSSPNSPPIRDGSPTTITSCVASVNPDALGDFFLLDVLFIPVLGVDEFVFVDLRFRLVLGARGVSAAR